ncbi:uncharacterized protein C8R40DRAFT_347866 [Lentinula edodes]|uniref:uncharacterized protein n=1 Tax=Lentinula edodes TaxID=5353 RepID=UPI001E8CC253|nr:uncharacterized protein C8R40DRAFT_347866 [Lentinula edodes]KAH7874058.1 hypothetical protein C8R40DRAFT_347866 [Lentinula edodes]
MNVAALLQDSPSDDRRRNNTSGNSNSSNSGNNHSTIQQQSTHSRMSESASQNGSNPGLGGWRRIEDGVSGSGTNSPGLTKNSSLPMQQMAQGAAHGHGLATTMRQPTLASASSTSPVLSRLNTHRRTLSHPTPPQQPSPSPSLPPASTPTVGSRGGVYGPATGRPVSGALGPDARGEQARMADSALALPRRESYREMDRERDREKEQPRILNIMDWQGERDRPKSGEERDRPPVSRRPLVGGGLEDLASSTLPPPKSHSHSPIMRATSSRRSSSSGGPFVDESVQENDAEHIRLPVRRHGSSRPGSAPTETIKPHHLSGPPPPRTGDFSYHANFQPPSHPHHFVPAGGPVSASIPAPAPGPGTLSLVPPQHQQSHQQHQLAQAQAQQQQIHVNAQGPAPIHTGTSPTGSSTGVMEPRGGIILNLNGPVPNGPPQKQFQNQFHTQFLPGLQLAQSAQPPLSQPIERERGHDRDRERDREKEWERDERDMRERELEREMYSHHRYPSQPHHLPSNHTSRRGSPIPAHNTGVSAPDRERDRERQRYVPPPPPPSAPMASSSRRYNTSSVPPPSASMGNFSSREKELRDF